MDNFTIEKSIIMSEFERKMKSLTDSLMNDYAIPDRFNGTHQYQLHLTNIESVVRQALWIGFLHGREWNAD